MSKGDRVKLVRDVEWGGRKIPKGTSGVICKMGSAGFFLTIKGEKDPVYVFRGEVKS